VDTDEDGGRPTLKARLAQIPPAELTAEQRALYDAILGGRRASGHKGVSLTSASGALVGPFNVLLRSPALGEAIQRLGEEIRFGTTLAPRAREIVVLSVAAASNSAFEWGAHEAIARIEGISDGTIEDLRARRKPTALAPDEEAAWGLARELLATDALSDAGYAGGARALGERGVLEVAATVGYFRMIAGILGAFAVGAPADPSSER